MTALRRFAIFLVTFAAAGLAQASPVTYTLQTVVDGKIGSHTFKQAIVTISMRSDTSYVVNGSGPSAGYLVNKTGPAQILIRDGANKITAHFAAGQVYVFFDSVNGLAGFGSSIAPTYPFALDCNNYPDMTTYSQDCVTGSGDEYDGTLGAVVTGYFPGPQSLTASTLMTGKIHSCASLYDSPSFDGGGLGSCPSKAPQGLQTDRGPLYVQDTVGGTTGNFGPFTWGAWDTANSGFLNVEVSP